MGCLFSNPALWVQIKRIAIYKYSEPNPGGLAVSSNNVTMLALERVPHKQPRVRFLTIFRSTMPTCYVLRLRDIPSSYVVVVPQNPANGIICVSRVEVSLVFANIRERHGVK
jgi:hypothetical protein